MEFQVEQYWQLFQVVQYYISSICVRTTKTKDASRNRSFKNYEEITRLADLIGKLTFALTLYFLESQAAIYVKF